MQRKIIHSPGSQNTVARKALATAIHKRAAVGAEVIRHHLAAKDGLILTERLELVLTAQMFQMTILDDEVGSEHGGCDFAAVVAIADEGVD